jgi:hypothetical protein
LLGALGCRPADPQVTTADIKGVWLRNDGSYKNGVSKNGDISYEEFGEKGEYVSVQHSSSDHFETYTMTTGLWNVFESVFTIRYANRYTMTLKPAVSGQREAVESVDELKVVRVTATELVYEHPRDGLISLVKGTYPPGIDPKYRHPYGKYFEELPGDPFASPLMLQSSRSRR